MRNLIFLISAILFSINVFAVNDFECTVKEVYKLQDSGLLKPGKGFVTPDVGSKFTVNRQSGKITAKKITNTMSGYMPEVFNSSLPKGKSYLAITLYPEHSTVDLLEIKYYLETKEKLFIYKGAFGEVISGFCYVI
jgi:hypothetical protein